MQTTSGAILATATTNQSGQYSLSTTVFPVCSGASVNVAAYFMRLGPNPGPPAFSIVGPAPYVLQGLYTPTTLTGSVTTKAIVIQGQHSSTQTLSARMATVYYTLNSAVDEMKTWSSRINSYIGGGSLSNVLVEYHANNDYSNAGLPWGIRLGYDRFAWGGNTRHELGHLVHMAIHDRKMNFTCYSLNFNYDGTPDEYSHSEWSCEYGMAATHEALATFFAVRSIIADGSNENSAFFCYGADANNYMNARHFCSNVAVASYMPQDPDRMIGVPLSSPPPTYDQGWVIGIGDQFANSRSHCARQEPSSCQCTNVDAFPDFCDDFQTNGFRTESNIVRFLWDLIDWSTDGGQDNDDKTIFGLVAELEAMTCTGICDGPGGAPDDCGADGTCNEPNLFGFCDPVSNWEHPQTHATGDRDSYNATDLASVLSGNQTAERTLNCVENAPDF